MRDIRREWEIEDLIECWVLDEDELALLANKSGAALLGFGLMLNASSPKRGSLARRPASPSGVVHGGTGQGGRGVVRRLRLVRAYDRVPPRADQEVPRLPQADSRR